MTWSIVSEWRVVVEQLTTGTTQFVMRDAFEMDFVSKVRFSSLTPSARAHSISSHEKTEKNTRVALVMM
jgi:hypothetical protein